jgi:hypothetical protein
MKLEIEYNRLVAEGSQATLLQEDDGKVDLFYIPVGQNQLFQSQGTVTMGLWDSLALDAPILVSAEKNLVDFTAIHLVDSKMWFFWTTQDLLNQRMAVYEDEGMVFDNTSPYRLFYTIDTEKLYMNIGDYWEFIGSPNIQNLDGYAALAEALTGIQTDVQTLNDADLINRMGTLETTIAGLHNYDDSALSNRVSTLETNDQTQDDNIQTIATVLGDINNYTDPLTILQKVVSLEERVTALENPTP